MPPSNQGFAQRPGLSPVQPSSPTQAQSQAQPAPPAPPLTVQTADTLKVSGMLMMMHGLHIFSVLLLENPDAAVKLLPCDHEVMGLVLETASCRNAGKAAYIRPKMVGPCTSGSYVHRAALIGFLISFSD
jgi:hypothetical protein